MSRAKFTATGLHSNQMRSDFEVTQAITNSMLEMYDLSEVILKHESLILTDIKVLHRIYCMLDHTALDINIEGLREEEYKQAKDCLVSLIEGCQKKGARMVYVKAAVAVEDYKIYYMTKDNKIHSYHRTFNNVEQAAHMILCYEESPDVKAVKLMNPDTNKVIYKWMKGKGRVV